MSKGLKISFLLVGLLFLVLIRLYEETLFYDPLLNFFKTDHTTQPLPDFETGKLLANVFLRFLLNGMISIGIIWVIFQRKGVVKFSILLYLVILVMLITAFFILLNTSEAGEYFPLFYVRRFLIQPLLLFLLVPAFYLQRVNNSL
tara:strand:- start:36473 stop:36907 length:435 start_codon:yes stop_codon:yes gene_type:complete